MANWLGLEGRVVIVTGGASGIANHVVTTLKAADAVPVIVDISVETGQELSGAYCVKCDVTSKESVQAMADAVVAKYGKIDALVNVAGINLPRLLVDVKGEHPEYELDDSSYDKMFDINVRGMVYCAQVCVRQMLKQGNGGVIVGMSSESGKEGSQGQSAYSATNGARDSLVRSWAKELGPYNIRVVGVAPGIMEATGLRTPAYNTALAYTRGVKVEDLSTDYTKVIPLGRDGKLDEVGNLVAFLVSDRASYITGTTVNISGGKSRG
ncbi:MAG: SDR family oxidoreductase [Oscillibacter sp.]|nr:SDR family oxidoreductase [Oscillibacter sp.]